jgi:hypothetical protein
MPDLEDGVEHASGLPDLLVVARETLPVVVVLDGGHGVAAEVPLDAPLAEGVGAAGAAEQIAAVGAPPAVLELALGVDSPHARVIRLVARLADRDIQHGVTDDEALQQRYFTLTFENAMCRKLIDIANLATQT